MPVGELRLQEKIRARHDARAVGGGQPLADAGLEVVPPLIRGVDARKPVRSASSVRAGVRSSFQAVP